MPTPWFKRIKETGQLKVFSKAGAWSNAVDAAIKSFNALSFGVKLVAEKEEKSANIVVILAHGTASYKYYGDTASTKSDFKADKLHGYTSTLVDEKKNEIFFAAIFLPGEVKGVTGKQKEVIIVHEFIHASGLNGLNDAKDDHEIGGIMNAIMKQEQDGGLIEYMPDKGAKSMPPFRVGAQTICKMQMLWAGKKSC
jgi:hypothetical protein